MMLNPFTALLWLSGVVWLFVSKASRPFRFLGVTYLLFLALMMAHAREGLLPCAGVSGIICSRRSGVVFMGARASVEECADWRVCVTADMGSATGHFPFRFRFCRRRSSSPTRRRWGSRRRTRRITTRRSCRSSMQTGSAGATWWRQVSAIYHSLPPDEQAVTGIFAGELWEASAINLFGPKYGLPQAISGHQNYWIWGPRGYTGQEMIVISGATLGRDQAVLCLVQSRRRAQHPLAMPWEHGNIYLCYGRKKTYAADWNDLKNYY